MSPRRPAVPPRVLHHMEDYLQTEFSELRVWLTSITEQWAVIAVQGPLARAGDRAAGRRTSISRRGDAAHERARRPRLRRARAAVPRQLHRRTRLRDQRAGATTAPPSGRRCSRPASARHHAIRHRGDACAARREGLHHRRPGDRWHGDPGRSRPRLDDRQDEARFRRQAFADAARHAARRTAGSWSGCWRPRCWRKARSSSPTRTRRCRSLGHVTSAYWSETLRRPIALALLSGGRARIGQTLYVPMADRSIAVRVTDPVFYDPQGARLHG